MNKNVIAIGADHGGYELKESIKKFLTENKIKYKDYGTHNLESTDYPDYGLKVAEAVARGSYKNGILVCGTGIGISIVANKVPGIRAALCNDIYTAKMSRTHNDTNILVLAGRVIGKGLADEIVKTWISTKFSKDGRHKRRIAKIKLIDKKYRKK